MVQTYAGKYLPIEVKYRHSIDFKKLSKGMGALCKLLGNTWPGIVVSKQWDDFGIRDDLFYIPLPHFLLLFD